MDSKHDDPNTEDDDHRLAAILSVYWQAYGGLRALFKSAFFWVSAVLLIISAHYWYMDAWWDQALSVLPNLLGFTLGGFAIFLAFGDERFRALISGDDPEDDGELSPFMEVSATFLHFVLVQVAALIAAIIGKATAFTLTGDLAFVTDALMAIRPLGDMLGYWLFLYGICSAAAAGIAIFQVAFWFDRFRGTNQQ